MCRGIQPIKSFLHYNQNGQVMVQPTLFYVLLLVCFVCWRLFSLSWDFHLLKNVVPFLFIVGLVPSFTARLLQASWYIILEWLAIDLSVSLYELKFHQHVRFSTGCDSLWLNFAVFGQPVYYWHFQAQFSQEGSSYRVWLKTCANFNWG